MQLLNPCLLHLQIGNNRTMAMAGGEEETGLSQLPRALCRSSLTGCCPQLPEETRPGAQLLRRMHAGFGFLSMTPCGRPYPLLPGCLHAQSKLPVGGFRSRQEGEPVARTFQTPLRAWHQSGHPWVGTSVSGVRAPQKGRMCRKTDRRGSGATTRGGLGHHARKAPGSPGVGGGRPRTSRSQPPGGKSLPTGLSRSLRPRSPALESGLDREVVFLSRRLCTHNFPPG